MPALLAKAWIPLLFKVLMAVVDRRKRTQRLPWGHQTRFACKFTCCNFLVRRWEWDTAKPLLAFFPVSWHLRDMVLLEDVINIKNGLEGGTEAAIAQSC